MKSAIDERLTRQNAQLPQTLPQYVRLICDSNHGLAVKKFEELRGQRFVRILIVGGGSKNSLLCQSTANYGELPVVSLDLEGSV